MAQKEVLPITMRIRLGNVVKNILVLLISLVVVLGFCEIILRVYNPLGFRIKGDKIILPVNKKEIIHHERVRANWTGWWCTRAIPWVSGGLSHPPNFADWLTIITVGGSTTDA